MAKSSRDHNAEGFWDALDRLVAEPAVRIDRPKGSPHPRFPSLVYPLDYGYPEGTQAGDGHEVDVWRGGLPAVRVTGVVCTVDMLKRDCKVKLLRGCSSDEAGIAAPVQNGRYQSAVLVRRPEGQ